MTREQKPSIGPKQRVIGLFVLFLPMAIAAYVLVGPEMSGAPRYLWQAAFFATLPGPAIMLALKRRTRREWFFVAICAAFVAWSIYKAIHA